jgi:hypothetical protein
MTALSGVATAFFAGEFVVDCVLTVPQKPEAINSVDTRYRQWRGLVAQNYPEDKTMPQEAGM